MSTLTDSVCQWVAQHPLPPPHVDCATAVMLKILDGKCKMKPEEKVVMAALYEAVKSCEGEKLGDEFHALIASAKADLSEAMRNQVYETRVLAETAISRPVMKGFKAGIRADGLFSAVQSTADFIDAQQSIDEV